MHPIRAQLIADGTIKPAPEGQTRVSHSALQARQREAGPVARALAILEAAANRQRSPRAHRDTRVW